MAKTVYCPVNGWDCPYFKTNGICTIENPYDNCDDYAAIEDFFSDLPDEDDEPDYEDELREMDLEMGYDPYLGCYTDDC